MSGYTSTLIPPILNFEAKFTQYINSASPKLASKIFVVEILLIASGNKDGIVDKVQLALQTGKDNENALNDNYMAQFLGKPVVFGDVVQ